MNKGISQKRAALITGGAERLGKASALKLADMGYDIALHFNTSAKNAISTSEEIKKQGVGCEIFAGNLGSEAETSHLLSKAQASFPHLNTLINNASVFSPSQFKNEEIKDFSVNFDINLKAPYILMNQFAKTIKKGQIINFLDTNIAKNKITHFSYLLSKKTLLDLTKLAAVDLAPSIRVNAIAPGLILPPKGKDDAFLNERAKDIPLKHKGKITNITQTIEFLIHNDFLTGQVIFVDGGEHLI